MTCSAWVDDNNFKTVAEEMEKFRNKWSGGRSDLILTTGDWWTESSTFVISPVVTPVPLSKEDNSKSGTKGFRGAETENLS